MKKIINGRIYDTEKARLVGDDSFGGVTDFKRWSEELYQKRTGEYFLYGEGGPASKYRRAYESGGWTEGEEIRPMTAEEARLWAEEHLSVYDYEAEFGEIEEDDSRTAVSITLSAALVEKLRRAASAEDLSLSACIEKRLEKTI